MRTTPSIFVLLGSLAIGVVGTGALAQEDPWSSLDAVDAGTADVGPLSESLIVVPIDMRVSDGFERIYRLNGVEGWEDQFARRDGAITAVFPRSVYLPQSLGGGVAIPAGTVFYIGDPPEWLRERYAFGEPAVASGGPMFASARIDTGIDVGAIDTRAPVTTLADRTSVAVRPDETAERPPTPWRSNRRRADRVSSLLALASAGE